MNEDEARRIVYSTRSPIEAAYGLQENEFISLVDNEGRWHRIEFSYDDLDGDYRLKRAPASKPDPLSEQLEELRQRGDLSFETPAELTKNGGERNTFGNYASIDNVVLAEAADRINASVAVLTKEASRHWYKAIEKAGYEIDEMVADHQARLLIREMATSRICVFPRDHGPESECYWYEKRPIRTSPNGEIIVSRPRQKSQIEYDLPHHARQMGFVGELILDDKEVFVLTRKGFDEAGVVPGPKDVVAPPDWEKAYDEYRRIWWTRVAKEQHVLVRVRDEDLRMDGEDVATDPPIGWGRGDILLGETGKAAFAAQRPGQPFKWLSSYGTAADPFTRNEYAHVDELVADLLADGRHVTDLRRCVGVISDVDVALRCLGEGMVAQRAGYGVYLLHPRVDGVHGDLLELSRDVEKSLMDKKLIVRALAFRSDYHHEWLYALPDHTLVAALAAQKDAGKAARKPDTSEVVGYDDDGQPITMDEVTRESYRRAPEGATFAVLAPFGYPGGEEQFEIDQYAENIRLRRRKTKSASADKGDGFTFEDF